LKVVEMEENNDQVEQPRENDEEYAQIDDERYETEEDIFN